MFNTLKKLLGIKEKYVPTPIEIDEYMEETASVRVKERSKPKVLNKGLVRKATKEINDDNGRP